MHQMFLLYISVFLSIACSEDNSTKINENNSTQDSLANQSAARSITLLALGDSYTIGQSVSENDRWPIQLKNQNNALNDSVKIETVNIIARTGWTTQELSGALDDANISTTYDLVSLLIGVNNQYRGYPVEEYPQEFKSLLNRAIHYAGGNRNHVFVVSIPDYGYTPFGKSKQETVSKEIDEYNAINKSIAEEYGIQYFDITPISRSGLNNSELVASDNLHPSGYQYKLWVEKIIADENFHQLLTK